MVTIKEEENPHQTEFPETPTLPHQNRSRGVKKLVSSNDLLKESSDFSLRANQLIDQRLKDQEGIYFEDIVGGIQ